jgi:glutaminase
MGATLANNGKNPLTGEQVIKRENVPHILSAMMIAGLYDGSGGWAWHVGIPAKSGVGGGIIAVVPGKGAMAVFAPPLDEAGNSVKAQKAIAYVADKLGINIFSPASVGLR